MNLPVSRWKYDQLALQRESDAVYYKQRLHYALEDNKMLQEKLNDCRHDLCAVCGRWPLADGCTNCRWRGN